MGAYKRFDKGLFKAFDTKARTATIKAMESRGYKVIHNPNAYAQDLIAEKDGKRFLVECEVKNVWRTSGGYKDFPWGSVQLPERKKKFFNEPTLFFIWNRDTTTAAVFWDHHVSDLEPVEVQNVHINKGERFFQIPLKRVRFIHDRT